MSEPPPARSTSLRTPAAVGPISPPAWMDRPSRRSSPIQPGAATTLMPSPLTASTTWPTRFHRPPIHTDLGQHHQRPQATGLFHLRPELRPRDRPQHPAVRPGASYSTRSRPTGTTRYPIIPTISADGYHPVLYVAANSGVYMSTDQRRGDRHHSGLDSLPRHDVWRVEPREAICPMSTSPT